jgi:trans-2,3-dihydro-3-hydroxyanthranilate isomerase
MLQSIAGEMNIAETVFLGPPSIPGAAARVRIFTPSVELPFAGHPTVGTAIFLASRDRAGANPGPDGTIKLVLEEGVGPVPVEVRFENGGAAFACFTTALLPEHRPAPHTVGELAALVGLAPSDLCPDGLVPELVSCGIPHYVVPVRNVDAVRRAALDLARWRTMLEGTWAHHVYVVAPEAEGAGVDVRVRMFAPGSGVPEDPATGSAAAALAGYLSAADGRAEGRLAWTVEQGIELGRPSLLYVEADRAGGATSAVRVGGHAVAVSEGVMTVPG